MATATINGHTYTDDDNATTGLAGGGHRTRFVPALADIVAECANIEAQSTTATDAAATATTQAGIATTQAAGITALANGAIGSGLAHATAAAIVINGTTRGTFNSTGLTIAGEIYGKGINSALAGGTAATLVDTTATSGIVRHKFTSNDSASAAKNAEINWRHDLNANNAWGEYSGLFFQGSGKEGTLSTLLLTKSGCTLSGSLAVTGAVSAATTVNTGSYTVSSLPSGTIGMRAIVTDATSPAFLGALTGGGAVKCPVFHNGTAWIVG